MVLVLLFHHPPNLIGIAIVIQNYEFNAFLLHEFIELGCRLDPVTVGGVSGIA